VSSDSTRRNQKSRSLLLKRQLLVVMVAFEALVPLRCGAHERAEEAPVLQPATGIR
jgi:hypothetical protein